MKDLGKLSSELCMTSLFRGIMDDELIHRFSEAADSQLGKNDRIRAYAALADRIYRSGGSLSSYVSRLVFEDDNLYVRLRSRGEEIPAHIDEALAHELSVLSELASLSREDFREALGVDYVSPFPTERIDLGGLYEERMRNVSRYGYGIFSSSAMFRLSDDGKIEPIVSADKIAMESFIGYEAERKAVVENTRAHLEGRPAANVLLCGDAGTGKSSTVKAVANEFFKDGLRLIELRKDQLRFLPTVMNAISENPLHFIIFIDDLSFNQNDDSFSMLKAALEGSAAAKADNAVIYATSNRRHIIKESFSDRDGDDVHRNDTMQETLSLSERFGLVILYQKPNRTLYLEIVRKLAERRGITMPTAELEVAAEAFALKRGSRSARCAEQFIDSLAR